VIQLAWSGGRRRGFFLRAETFYSVLTALEAVGAPLAAAASDFHGRSHGESFLDELERAATTPALHLMDEPEAALSVIGQLRLLRLINFGVQAGAQFLISTHSPILLAYPSAMIYELSEDGVREVSYHDTAQFTLTKSFLDSPDRFLKDLFQDD
jgi:predicted ATPase